MSQFIGRALTVMALFMVTGFQVSNAAEQLIKEFVDLIQERGTAEWVDAYGRPVGLEGPDTDRNLLQMRPIYDPEAVARGAESHPTLIGWDTNPTPHDYGGYSGQTCEYNKLYYQRQTHLPSGAISDQDLYRRTVRFQLQ